MADERHRIPVDIKYAEAIGQAAYIFSYLEWGVIWCVEKMEECYIQTVSRKTAGQIANDFLRVSEAIKPNDNRSQSVQLAERFYFLVQRRNALLHSNPGTAPDGNQQLFRDNQPWLLDEITDFSDDLAKLAIEVNAFFHDVLNQKFP